MRALIIHNVTTVADLAAAGDAESAALIARDKDYGRGLAIFRRMPKDDKAPIEPGDRLRYVGTLNFPDLTKPDWGVLDVCNAAYAAGNAPGGPNVEEYRSWQVRSLSVGDVVLTEGEAFACAPYGWTKIDATLDEYKSDDPLGFADLTRKE